MSLKYNFGGIEGSAGAVAGMVPSPSSDAFDFKASEPTTATETYYEVKLEECLISSWSSGTMDVGNNDGVVDAADYVVWRKGGGLDTVDIDLSLSAAVDTGVPATMPEYALLL